MDFPLHYILLLLNPTSWPTGVFSLNFLDEIILQGLDVDILKAKIKKFKKIQENDLIGKDIISQHNVILHVKSLMISHSFYLHFFHHKSP